MKKLLLLIVLVLYSFTQFGQTTHFSQDFLAGTATSNFVGSPPSIGQFTEIATAAGVTTTITTGRLQFARASATNPTRFSRGFNFTPTPSSMYCQFSFGVTSAVAQTTAATFNFGGTNLADGGTTVADVYSKVSVNLNATNGFTLQSGATISAVFTGSQDITWVMNNTGATFTYVAPNGINETLGNDQFDLWVGTTKVFNDLAVNAPTQTINRFKFNFDAGLATLSFDNVLMRDVTGSLLVNTNVVTPDSMLVKLIGTNKNVGIGKNIVMPGNKLEIKSDTLNKSGLRFTNLKSTTIVTPQNGKALSVNTLGDVVLVNTNLIPDSLLVKFTAGTGLIKNVGIGTVPTNKFEIKSDTLNKSGLRFTNLKSSSPALAANGKALTVSPAGDVILVNSITSSVPDSMIVKFVGTGTIKNVGIGKNIVTPANKLEVKSDTLDRSGLRLTNLKSTSVTSSANGKALSVNALGDIILVNSVALSTPDSMLVKLIGTNKNVGIGKSIVTPGNKLEIRSDTLNKSGLRFTNLKSSSPALAANGKALTVSPAGDVILVNSTTSSIPDSMIVKFVGIGSIKNVGIGTIPTNKFEIKSDTLDRSGLKFTRLNSLSATKPANGKGLSVDGNGNVILIPIATYSPTTPDSMLVKFTGTGLNKNVGIGTVSPNNKLEINGIGSGLRFTNLKSTNSVSTWGGKVLSVDANGDVVLVKDSIGTTSVATSAWTSIANNRIQNANTGAVVIGALNTTALPGNYKLYVKDGILTEEVKIAAEGTLDWADYVFAKNYKLRTLSEVENFVKINKHLPGVPSAEEVSKNGINVAKMEAKLLEKIEELTLYMIDMKKENNQLKNRLKRLEKKK